jgi:hypothetical protein
MRKMGRIMKWLMKRAKKKADELEKDREDVWKDE